MYHVLLNPDSECEPETLCSGRSTTSTFRAQTINRLDSDLVASRADVAQLRAGRDKH